MGVGTFQPPDMPQPENSDVPVIFRKGVGAPSLGIRLRVLSSLTLFIAMVGVIPWLSTRLVLAGWVPFADTLWLSLFLEAAMLIAVAYLLLYPLEDIARYVAQHAYWWNWLHHEGKNQDVRRAGSTAYQNKWLAPEKERTLTVNVSRADLNAATRRLDEMADQVEQLLRQNQELTNQVQQDQVIIRGKANIAATQQATGTLRPTPSASSVDADDTLEIAVDDDQTQDLDLMNWYESTIEYRLMDRALAGQSLSIPALDQEGISRYRAQGPKAKLIACNMLLAKEGREPILHPDYKNSSLQYVHQVAAVKLAEYRAPTGSLSPTPEDAAESGDTEPK